MKKILMYRWKAYNYLDIKFTFQKLGYEIKEVYQDLLNYDVDEAFAEKLKAIVKAEIYDFLFTVNYFPLISKLTNYKLNNQVLFFSYRKEYEKQKIRQRHKYKIKKSGKFTFPPHFLFSHPHESGWEVI